MNNSELKQKISEEAKNIEDYIIKTRRYLHMNPETAFEEKNTAIFIEKELQEIGYQTKRVANTGIIASVTGPKKGITVALRADIDALNVTEENEFSFRSQIPGKMHACGHDAHTAMLLGAAKIIFKYKNELEGTIKLIFQPAEEGGGGGKKIVDEGHLNDVDAVFGIHVWRELPSGTIATRKGATLASADRYDIIIKGKGGHAAAPHQTRDPTSVAVDIYNALQKIVTREIDPFQHVILTVPEFIASNAHNIIPEKVIMRGTFRTLNHEVREHILKRIAEIVEGYSKAWRCTGTVEFDPVAYPPLVNNAEIVDEVKGILNDLGSVETMDPSMGGEDFAFYLQKARGTFIVLGIQNQEKGIIFPHHHPKFNVDEAVLYKGTAVYSTLAFYSRFKQDA